MQKAKNFAFWIDKLANLAEGRVKKYGASYFTFGLFGVVNYPLANVYEIYTNPHPAGIILRGILALLCLFLLFYKQWPEKLKFYLPLYWLTTITFTIPFLGAYFVLKEKFSLDWLINFNIGVMIGVLVLDSLTFVIIEAIGIILGSIFFYSLGNKINSWPTDYNTLLFFYMFLCIVILGTIFSKNKEVFNHFKEKSLDQLNQYLENQVINRTAELEQALQAKTEFLNNMSHEIRTPIQGFTTISEGLVEHWREFSDQRKFELANQVSKNARRLSSLLKHLLDLSKFNAGKMLLYLKPCNLNDLTQMIIEECRALYLGGKQLDIQFRRVDIPSIMLDFECMGQVLRNLLINAIKFSPNNSIISINLEATEISYDNDIKTQALHFTIKDQGVGVPLLELNSIFAPFTQSTRTKTRAGGTGLGLAIAREIIEAHHGKIWAANNEDRGSSFHFTIPIHQSTLLDNHKIIAENALSQIDLLTKQEVIPSKVILMIDDEDTCLMSMELLLFGSGYCLYKASGGYAGLEYLKAHYQNIDIIILDLMMPDIYGLNLLTEIKKDPYLAKIPIILQTGSSDTSEIDRAFKLGIFAYIKKPYQKNIIITEINKALKL